MKTKLEEENDEDSLKFLSKAVDTVRKQVGDTNFFGYIKTGSQALNAYCYMYIAYY